MSAMTPKIRTTLRVLLWSAGVVVLFVGLAVVYIKSHPLVFNESFWEHAHCIKAASLALSNYADSHHGQFPSHPGGYGDALLLLNVDWFYALTGPGYDETPFIEAKREGKHLPEEECGRVYIQGLTTKTIAPQSKLAILFDKLPTPGGDHCHFLPRIWAPLGAKLALRTARWNSSKSKPGPHSREQIELLAKEGIARDEAERLYASQPKQQ